MKTALHHILHRIILFLLLLIASIYSHGQGKVVINEYMPWSGCNTTSEFIELLNFGPGPVDISCYIVTNGQYAVTLPPKTILWPGQYYILAGQDTLAKGCGNIDSTVHVRLNWTTCKCTDKPIPTTGDGFMNDGGNANEKVVLLDPNLKVIDAVTRDLPASASISITTAPSLTGCTSKTFNLSNMSISYEALGMSTGKSNSFARQVDGDCGWVKTPQQSAHAPNKTGKTSSVTYTLTTTQAMDCGKGGSISINVSGSNVSSLFPMNYTIACDSNNDGIYDFNDVYTYGSDNTAPTIDIDGLKVGRYSITVSSALDCDLSTFPVTILPCYPVLPVQLVSFNASRTANNEPVLTWSLNTTENLQSIIIEQSNDGASFTTAGTVPVEAGSGLKTYRYPVSLNYQYYRLRILSKDGNSTFSPVINITKNDAFSLNKLWPNPAHDEVYLELYSLTTQLASYSIYTVQNTVVLTGKLQLHTGKNVLPIAVSNLPRGMYQMLVRSTENKQPISFRFVKE